MSLGLRYLLAWIPMVPLAVANGLLRVSTYGRRLPELTAHQLSTLIGSALMSVYIYFVVRSWPPPTAASALRLGALWAAMTVAFEFSFGRFVAGHSWSRLLHDYDLSAGRLWLLFVAWIGVAPLVLRRAARR
jgi:hypothetical protein